MNLMHHDYSVVHYRKVDAPLQMGNKKLNGQQPLGGDGFYPAHRLQLQEFGGGDIISTREL